MYLRHIHAILIVHTRVREVNWSQRRSPIECVHIRFVFTLLTHRRDRVVWRGGGARESLYATTTAQRE